MMKNTSHLLELEERYPVLSDIKGQIKSACEVIANAFAAGSTLYVCGNGGSASDAEHIAGELLKGFCLKRPVPKEFKRKLADEFGEAGKFVGGRLQCGLRTVSLTGHPALSTAFGNDVDGSLIFAQQLYAMGKTGDVLMGISTSGNSNNILHCMRVAKAMDIKTILLTGESGGKCKELADISICVPAKITHHIQELHLPIYHTMCLILEEHFYGNC